VIYVTPLTAPAFFRCEGCDRCFGAVETETSNAHQPPHLPNSQSVDYPADDRLDCRQCDRSRANQRTHANQRFPHPLMNKTKRISLFDATTVFLVAAMFFVTGLAIKQSFAAVYGMPPQMYQDYIMACYKAKVNPNNRIVQTIGNAPASAGTHAQDGTVLENGIQYGYGAALDLRSKDLTDQQKKVLLSHLFDWGFVGWYRYKGSFFANRHFHMVYARYSMKRSLRNQVHAFMNDRDGLAGNQKEVFKVATVKQKQKLRTYFLRVNPARN
jgi:hypothetical protein